jgi:hypothetical protein
VFPKRSPAGRQRPAGSRWIADLADGGHDFEATRLALRLWCLGICHLTQPKNNVSALGLKRLLGVSYNAAWSMKRKLMQVMDEREANPVLGERVEVDDTYLGRRASGQGWARSAREGAARDRVSDNHRGVAAVVPALRPAAHDSTPAARPRADDGPAGEVVAPT